MKTQARSIRAAERNAAVHTERMGSPIRTRSCAAARYLRSRHSAIVRRHRPQRPRSNVPRSRGPNYVRERTWWTIFRRYAKRVPLAFLKRGLRDRDEVIRIEAARAYGRLTAASDARDLEPLLHDPILARPRDRRRIDSRPARRSARATSRPQIAENVHVPPPAPDPLAESASAAAIARATTVRRVKATSRTRSPLDPQTAREMLSPAHGPHPRLRFVTSEGNFYVVLYPEWAPLTVANFLNLTNRGFFDNNRWFRIVPDFVVQTGEQDDKKAPGPGYTIHAEQNPLEQNSLHHLDGPRLRRQRNPNLTPPAREYYITLSPQYHLDGPFTVFGAVTSGFDVFGRLTEHDRVIRIERIRDAMIQ